MLKGPVAGSKKRVAWKIEKAVPYFVHTDNVTKLLLSIGFRSLHAPWSCGGLRRSWRKNVSDAVSGVRKPNSRASKRRIKVSITLISLAARSTSFATSILLTPQGTLQRPAQTTWAGGSFTHPA